jgi:hypothetical protein
MRWPIFDRPVTGRMRPVNRTAHAPFGDPAHVRGRTSPHAARSSQPDIPYGTALGSSESAVGFTPNAP